MGCSFTCRQLWGIIRAFQGGARLAVDIFLGNILTISVVWGFYQFHKHDYQAPWLAYAAFVFPIIYAMATWATSGA